MHIKNSQGNSDALHISSTHKQPLANPTNTFSEILNKTFLLQTDLAKRDIELSKTRRDIVNMARADPEAAKKITHDYTYNALGSPLLDLSDRPNIRYSLTGELVTSSTQVYFQKISQAVQKQCDTLYRQEVSRGTPAVEILEKIFSLHDSMPLRFREMLGI